MFIIAYSKTTWVDDTTPLSAINLNKIEEGIRVANLASSETVVGLVELATAAETTTGTDITRAVHPAGLKIELDRRGSNSGTFTEATAIAATSSYTKEVALGAADYKLAIVHFNFNLANSTYGGLVIARTTIASGSSITSAEGASGAGGAMSQRVSDYLSLNVQMHRGVSGSDNIYLEHVYINGSNLEFKWAIPGETGGSLAISVDWTVLR